MYEGLMGEYVVVGYGNYGLRAGILDAVEGTTARLRDSRHVFFFATQPDAAGCQGVEALHVAGPAAGSKLGPAVPLTVVSDVRRIGVCSAIARAAFISAGWPK